MCKMNIDLAQIHTLAAIPNLNPCQATFFVHEYLSMFNLKYTCRVGL